MEGLEQITGIVSSNAPTAWLAGCGMTLAFMAVVLAVKWFIVMRVSRLTARTSSRLDDGIVEAARATRAWLMFFPAVLFGAQSLALPDKLALLLGSLATIALFIQAGLWLGRLMKYYLSHSQKRALESDPASATSLAAVAFIGQVLLWSILLLLMLDNLGVDVTALVAGLGVGGIAVALAVQNILGDLFASLSIIIDKPFVLGDFIIVDDFLGSVEHVGLKTTRLRSLGGEQIVFSNSDLLNSRVRNYKRMYERRITFSFGVVYKTRPEQLEQIAAQVGEIIRGIDGVRFDRAHFKGFGNSSLDFEVVYWMLDPDFNKYMDAQELINLAIMRYLGGQGIDFAFPSRSLYMETPVRVETMTAASES